MWKKKKGEKDPITESKVGQIPRQTAHVNPASGLTLPHQVVDIPKTAYDGLVKEIMEIEKRINALSDPEQIKQERNKQRPELEENIKAVCDTVPEELQIGFIRLASYGDLPGVAKQLLEYMHLVKNVRTSMVNIDKQTQSGVTALMMAAMKGRTLLGTFLLSKNPNLDLVDMAGKTVFYYAEGYAKQEGGNDLFVNLLKEKMGK